VKHLFFACKALVIAILVVKLAMLAAAVGGVEQFQASVSIEDAIAQEGQGNTTAAPLEQERELLKLLAMREQELKRREEALDRERERLTTLKLEIAGLIDQHRAVMGSIVVADDQKYADLVKVYEATPPAQAAAMLERLDRKTAAAIIMRMRSRQAGEIWGHLDPNIAVAITGEITRMVKAREEEEL